MSRLMPMCSACTFFVDGAVDVASYLNCWKGFVTKTINSATKCTLFKLMLSYFPPSHRYVAHGVENATVVVENGVVFVSAPNGLRVSIPVDALVAAATFPDGGNGIFIDNIDCVLGTCVGYMYPGSIMINAVDSDFWVVVDRLF